MMAFAAPKQPIPSEVAQAEALFRQGRLPDAESACRAFLAESPLQTNALLLLSIVLMEQKKWEEAETILQDGCARHPDSFGFHLNLGRLYYLQGNLPEAMPVFEKAAVLRPDDVECRKTLARIYFSRRFVKFSPLSRQAMILCLKDPDLSHNLLMTNAWVTLLFHDPALKEGLAMCAAADYAAFRAAVTPPALQRFLNDEFLVLGLQRLTMKAPVLERGLIYARRWLLERAAEGDISEFLPFLCALGRYCHFNEYAFAASPAEKEMAAQLREKASEPALAALSSCYEPLLKDASRFQDMAARSGNEDFRALVRVQVDEPQEERRIRTHIPAFTEISNDISRAVQGQYEENPYPSWTAVGVTRRPEGIAAQARGKSILVAGCGTGREAAETALLFPAAHVTAIDLSRTSLGYAIRKCRESRIGNITFFHGDILAVDKLGKKFDLVISSGVLHHMENPFAGWRALCGVLAEGGIMKIALYSTIAREGLHDIRALIREKGFAATPEGIRDFRAYIISLPEDDPFRKRLATGFDFYTISSCRDLLFHVQEHTFTLPEIGKMAEELGLKVLWKDLVDGGYLEEFRKLYPRTPGETNLDHWHEFEKLHPRMFSGMYNIWFCRRDEAQTLDSAWAKNGMKA